MNTETEVEMAAAGPSDLPIPDPSGFGDVVGDPILVSAGDSPLLDADNDEPDLESPIATEFNKEPCCSFVRCFLRDGYPKCQLSMYFMAVFTAILMAVLIQYFGFPAGVRQLYDAYIRPSLKKVLQRPLEWMLLWFDTEEVEEFDQFDYQHEF